MPVRKHDHRGTRRRVIKLAPGLHLCSDAAAAAPMLLVRSGGDVQLNEHALAILELCDGSRSRDRVVMDAMLRSSGRIRISDVVEFIDAARARGWLVEDD